VLRRPLESAQYACREYTDELAAYDIQASMSRIGNPYDNAKAESFIKTLKQEEVDGRDYRDLNHARTAIGTFIELVYNRQRLHSALGYRPPAEFEANLPRHADYPRCYPQAAQPTETATSF
jgi:putative transposase